MTPTDTPQPSGERFVPELMGGELIDAEHQVRYRFALPFVTGKRVLDAGCGTGWGSKLLAAAGARQVIGVDLSAEAVEDSRRRTPEAEFVEGNLQNLPFAAASFDVVVCFEALEHTHDTDLTLDNLVRVLTDDGILFVSSPNPAVYPAGNPFHFHEMPPDELHGAVAARLRNVAVFRQHLHLSSTLYADGGDDGEFAVTSIPVRPIEPGHDPYSVAVASNAPLPRLSPAQALAPSDQLDNLGALAVALTEERDTVAADHTRMVAEREQLLAVHDELNQRLTAAGSELARVLQERESAIAGVDGLRRRIAALAEERDRFAVSLVRVEQELSVAGPPLTVDDETEAAALRVRLDDLNERAEQLERDLSTIQATFSWRVTRPLRRVRAATSRRAAR